MYDGHGKEGDLCAVFCKDTLPALLGKELKEHRTVEKALKRAFNRTNDEARVDESVRPIDRGLVADCPRGAVFVRNHR